MFLIVIQGFILKNGRNGGAESYREKGKTNFKNNNKILLLFIPQVSEDFLVWQQHSPIENLSHPQEVQPPPTHAMAH